MHFEHVNSFRVVEDEHVNSFRKVEDKQKRWQDSFLKYLCSAVQGFKCLSYFNFFVRLKAFDKFYKNS